MAESQPIEGGKAQPVFEGTWDELLRHDQEFAGKKLRLSIVTDEEQPSALQQDRIAAIDAVFGKYAYLGVSSDDLHRERQSDKMKENQVDTGS